MWARHVDILDAVAMLKPIVDPEDSVGCMLEHGRHSREWHEDDDGNTNEWLALVKRVLATMDPEPSDD